MLIGQEYYSVKHLPLSIMRLLLLSILMFHAAVQAEPDWLSHIPTYTQKVCGIGSSSLATDRGAGLAIADQQAKIEVLQTLRLSVHSSINIVKNESIAANGKKIQQEMLQQFHQDSKFDSQVENLPGLRIVETYIDPINNTAYALACLDMEIVSQDIIRRINDIESRIYSISSQPKRGGSFSLFNELRLRYRLLQDVQEESFILGAFLDEGISNKIKSLQVKFDKLIYSFRNDFTFNIEKPRDSLLIDAALVENMRQHGFVLERNSPRYVISTRSSKLVSSSAMGFYVSRLVVNILLKDTLLDSERVEQINCKGIGVDPIQAEIKLRNGCQHQSVNALSKMLD